ncbi:Uu.00g085160.m01.CDS01 [Anthostomella pinea]|uniref:Thymidylate kinase n=1 Tax=Anthostomella pinea TaxID=933095 RepID=A0AAI8VN21_9PEZI|nr:Uu.00g085160.m01.CDS01 [Anthostomella pinea]
MASINDLATAATIASSAVALQSSPPQQVSQPATQDSPPPETPLSPSSPSAQLLASAAASASAPAAPGTTSRTQPEADSLPPPTTSIATNPSTPGPGPGQGPVLAAPQISENPLQAQIPAPAPSAVAAEASSLSSGGPMEVDGVDGVGEQRPLPVQREKEKPLPKPVRGAFVVFEGMDRAGKTTQAKLLQLRCIESGRGVKFMRFPDRTTPIGQMIDSYLKGQSEIEDHVIHLLFSANRWEAIKKIKSELAAGHTVVCDRFYHSGIVYSAAKQLPSLSLSWAKAPEIGLPRPDMVLFLDLEETVARERGGWGGEIYEKGEMQRRVRDLFWGLSMGDLGNAVVQSPTKSGPRHHTRDGPSGVGGSNGAPRGDVGMPDAEGAEQGEFRQEEEDIHIVDADLDVESLSEKVWEVVLPRLEAVERGEVGRTVRTVG